MTTTPLKLPAELKQRAIAAAQELGMTPHAFMVEAIRQAAALAEQRTQFISEANASRDDMLESGQGYDADEVHAYLRKRIGDPAVPRPKTKPWRS